MTIILIFILWFSQLAAPPSGGIAIEVSEGINPFAGVWAASTSIESSNNPYAYNEKDQVGGSWGIVQIGQSMLSAYNHANSTNYVLSDCFDVEVSRRIFMWHHQKYYPDIEAGCRSWNGGNNWRQKTQTKDYYWKIQKFLNRYKNQRKD